MTKHSINNVPRYFVPYTNDCFQNAYGAIISYMNLKPDLILADYLSFMYDAETGYLGANYLQRPSTSIEFTEEELNTSLEYVYYPATSHFSSGRVQESKDLPPDMIKISLFIEDNADIAFSRLKELINDEKPVVAVVDMYYMSYHRAYQKEHGLHAVVITGYNEEEGYVELFDKYRLSSSDFDGRLPINDLMQARGSENFSYTHARPIRNLWMEFNKSDHFFYNEKRWISIIKESCKRMKGGQNVPGCKCGLERLDVFRRDLLAKKEEKPVEEMLNFFRYYYSANFKVLSRSRYRYNAFLNELGAVLPESLITEVSQLLGESAKRWEISANLSLRLAITKNIASVDNVCEQIQAIQDYESRAVEKLFNYIK